MNTYLALSSSSLATGHHRSRFSSRSWRIHQLTALVERRRVRGRTDNDQAPQAGICPGRSSLLGRATSLAFAAVTLAFVTTAQPARADVLDTWHAQPSAPSGIVNKAIYSGGKYWSVGSTGRVMHSTNLQSWTVAQTPSTSQLTDIVHVDGQFVVVGYQGIYTSSDGAAWTQRYEAGNGSLSALAYGNGKYVAVGSLGTVLHSSDAITWTPASFNLNNFTASAVTFGNGQFAAFGEGQDVFTSPDGATWTRRPTGFYARLESATYGDGRYVASGWDRVIISSTDGINWTKVTPTVQYNSTRFWEIAYLNGRYIAGGRYGALVSSTDAVNWTSHPSGATSDLHGFVYNGNALVVLRSSGVVRTSAAWAPVSTGGDDNGGGSGGGSGGDNGGGSGGGSGGDNGGGSGGGGSGGGGGGSGNGGDTSNSTSRLVNISSRAWVGTGGSKLISGFYIQGTAPMKVLVRGVGPALADYGVNGALADPQLQLFNSAGAEIAFNDDWHTHANQADVATSSAQVGAFALPAGSKDSVLLVTLQPGLYSIHVGGANNGTGVALAEVYAVGANESSRLVNISSRTFVGTGSDVTIAGFFVNGSGPRRLLIRGVGPSLARFGVGGALANPRLAVYNSSQAVVAENDDWATFADQAGLAAATSQVGAFSLDAGSQDAAMIVTLNPGLYSAIASGVNNATGVGLIEVYELP